MWLLATVLDNGAIGHMDENGGLEDQRDVVCLGAVRGAVLKFLESTNTRQTVSEEESYL